MSQILYHKKNWGNFLRNGLTKNYSVADKLPKKSIELPKQVDVVIIGMR